MENDLKKDMTVNDLAELMMKVFGGLKNEFSEFKSEMIEFRSEMIEFKSEMIEFKSEMFDFREETKKNFKELDGKVDTIDHRTIMMKQVIEKDLHTQVRW